MADPRYGAGGEGFEGTLARMQQQASAADELRRKEEARAGAEERVAGAGTRNVGVRGEVADATARLSSELTRSADLLNAETRALEANTAAWRARLTASSGVARAPSTAAPRAPAAEPAFVGPVESPQRAQARYDDAVRAQAAAEAQQASARKAAAAATRTGASGEELAPLVAQREAANLAVADARAQSKAAQRNVQAQEQAAASQGAARAAQEAENARLVAAERAHAAAEEAAARAAAEAAATARRQASAYQRSVVSGAGILAAGGGGFEQRLLPPGSNIVTGGPSSAVRAAEARSFIAGPAGGSGRAAEIAGHGVPSLPTASQDFGATEQLANRNAVALERMAGAQGNVNRMVQQSVAQYGASSQALQRHGALTAEFIQAFSRGEVTLQEFSSQMLTTMGKFGGWAVAGAAVFGVVDALRKLGEGAKEAQSGYVQLTRFIPNVNQGQAVGAISDISTQLNVPIKDVVDTMTVMARTFKTLPEAATATRAAVLASRLDQIAPSASAPYLVGISQAFGLNAQGTLGVVDSLNALQRTYGARVAETLPGLAKAAPAALAAGVDQHTLEALIGVGVRAGFSGSQVATAVARSATTFVQKPQDQAILESYGFNPNQPYGDLIKQISSFIAARDKAGQPVPGKELRDLAIGLAGPQLGARTMAAILARGGDINKFAETAAHPGETAAEERQKQLGAISEQFKSIGIGLENFGAGLASSGILIPLQALLSILHQVGSAADTLISPLATIGTALSQLPGPLREILGAVALGAAGQAVYRSTFGKTATGALSQVPGLSFLDTPNSQAVRQLTQTQRVGLEFARRQQEQSSYAAATAAQGYSRAYQSRAGFQLADEARPALGTEERAAYEQQLTRLRAAEVTAEKKALEAQAQYLSDLEATRDFQARLLVFKGKELSDAEKIALASATGGAATPFGAPTTSPILTAQRATVAELERNAALTPEARKQALIAQGQGATPERSSVSTALGAVPEEAIATQALRVAEAERPGFIAGKFSGAQARLGGSSSLAAVLGATALGGIAGSGAVGAADRRISQAGGFASTVGSGLVGGVGGALGTAFQGILAAQLVNMVAPGKTGDFLGNVITGGSLGLGGASLLNSVLGRFGVEGRLGGPAAFAIGAGASQVGSSNPLMSILGGGLVGGGIGAALGSTGVGAAAGLSLLAAYHLSQSMLNIPTTPEQLTKQGAPQFRPSTTLGEPGAANILELLNPFHNDRAEYASQKAAYEKRLTQWKAEQAQISSLGGLNLSGDQVQSFGDIFQQQLSDAFTKTGQDAKAALAGVQHRIGVLATNIGSFGLDSQSGQQSSRLLQEAAGRSIAQAGADPQNIDQYVQIAQKADQALGQARQQNFAFANARARSGQDRADALQQLIASEQQAIQSEYTGRIPELQQSLTQFSERYNQLLAQRGREQAAGHDTRGTTKQLNTVGTQITQTQGQIRALQDAAGQARQLNQASDAQAQAGVYSAIQGDITARTTLAQSRAGADPGRQLQAQLRGLHQQLDNARSNLTLNPEQQRNEQAQLNAKIIDTNRAIVAEQLARIQSLQKLQEAQVPLNQPLGLVNKVLADARGQLAFMESHRNAFSPEQIQAQQAQVIADQRARTQQQVTNLRATRGLAQSQIATYDPVAQARGQLSSAEQTAQFMQAHAQDFNYADIINAMSAVNSARQAVADAIHQQQAQMSQASGEIAKASAVGNSVAQATVDIGTATRALQSARTPVERAQATASLYSAYNARYAAGVARADAGYDIQGINQTGFARYQAAIAVTRAQYDIRAARGPDERLAGQRELAQARQQQIQADQQHAQSVFQLREARASGDPLAQARIAVEAAHMAVRMAHGEDQKIAAETQLANAEAQLAATRLQRTQRLAQIAEVQATGDAVKQAQIALSAARTELGQARTPQQREDAQLAIAQAQVQLHQAQQQRTQAQGGLAQAQSGGDSVRQAQIAVLTAQTVLNSAHGTDEVIAAQTQVANAQQQLHQAQQQQIQAQGAYQSALAQGDPVRQAQIGVDTAQKVLANAHGIDEITAAQTNLANANYSLHTALEGQIASLTALAASGTRDPLQKLRIQINGARKALASAVTDSEKTTDQTALNDLQNQYQEQLFSQGQSTIDFQLQMRQISTAQAISGLRQLLGMAGSVQEQQQILLRIRQLQMGGSGTGGAFNLAPGSVKLPTVYDVQRSLGGIVNPIALHSALRAAVQNQINVYVGSSADVPAVADAIDRVTTGSLSAQLRAAGVI